MNMQIPEPVSHIEFTNAVSVGKTLPFLRWTNSLFHTAFVHVDTGKELPVLVKANDTFNYVVSANIDDLMAIIGSSEMLKEGELEIKTLTLAEIARQAKHLNCEVRWIQGPSSLQFGGCLLDVLGLTGIVHNLKGKEVIYQAEVFQFDTNAAPFTLPVGAVQRWWTPNSYSTEVLTETDAAKESAFEMLYVYDDQLDWSDPHLPQLPKDAVALSQLAQSAQAFFNQLKASSSVPQEVIPEQATAPEGSSRQSSLIPTELLDGYWRLRKHISEYIVPQTKEIKLVIAEDDETEELEDKTEYWVIRFEYPKEYFQASHVGMTWVTPAELRNSHGLPTELGTYPINDALREHLVNHIAWKYFHHGRHFINDAIGHKNCLTSALFARPDNGDQLFKVDFLDSRFPCMARWQCGEHEIPVLLLGQVRSNYLCQPLVDMTFPDHELPAVIPRRDELIYDGVCELYGWSNALLLPSSMIDFPEPWYRGARISDQQMIRTELADRQRKEIFERSASLAGFDRSIVGWVVMGAVLAVAVAGGLILATWY